MNTNMRFIALILILIAPTWAVGDNYLCITDKATGFAKKNGKFDIANISSGQKYIFNTEDATLSLFGEGTLARKCIVEKKYALCSNEIVEFNMHRNKLKFMVYQISYGYVWETTDDTPQIAIGTCSKF